MTAGSSSAPILCGCTAAPARIEDDYQIEQVIRLTVLEVLCAKRRAEPSQPGVFMTDLEALTGKPREHLEFTIWYLAQKKFVTRGDSAQLTITVDGVDYLEEHLPAQQRLLPRASTVTM